MTTDMDIPKRALFKAAEVCSIAGVQPYVLKSWEAEFPGLGRSMKKDGSRVYRRGEVELVLRIKHLLFVDGLTLGAARRQLEGEQTHAAPEAEASLEDLFSQDVRDRVADVRRGLQGILELLSGNGHVATQQTEPKVIARPAGTTQPARTANVQRVAATGKQPVRRRAKRVKGPATKGKR